jgi:hypothetical protein
MNYFAKSNVFFLAVIFLLNVSCSACLAVELKEIGLLATPMVSGGKITGVKVSVKAANGGPQVNTLPLNYPESSILTTTVYLTAGKGSYKIELLENGKTSLTLTAQDGKTVNGSGRLSVSAGGTVQYKVTAKKARNVTFNLSFSPLVAPDDPPVRKAAEEKISYEGDGLNLTLTCVAGNNCRLQVRNMSRSKAYRNILFRIDYKMMTRENTMEKSKSGVIEAALLPDKTGEWLLALVFGEPPKDIKILLIKAEAVDPAEIKEQDVDRQKNGVIPLTSLEK